MNPIEIEVIGLNLVRRALDDFVNRALLHVPESGGPPAFRGTETRDLFAVRLLDFLETVDKAMTGVQGSCVDLLEVAVATGSFDRQGSIEELREAAEALRTWLDERIAVKFWLPSLNLSPVLTLTRDDLLYVAGNTSKHNLSRLTRVARRLRKILKDNQYQIGEEDSWFAVDDFEEKFKEDLLAFYCARIAGLLNDVRWGIHAYLLPEFQSSYERDPDSDWRYTYRYPVGVTSRFARECYWSLMNSVRAKPYISRFVVPEYMMEHPFLLGPDGDREDREAGKSEDTGSSLNPNA